MFVSDNVSCACPEVMKAIEAANQSDAVAYGGDEATLSLNRAFSVYFEKEAVGFPVGSGTAANALALALVAPRLSAIYCHERAHIETTECGATEAWTGGAKLSLLPGEQGRIDIDCLRAALRNLPRGRPQSALPSAVSITQGTEAGTIYLVEQIAEIASLAHEYGLRVHMDGARFSNALVALGCSPANMTWRAGVDILSYGATKNGGLSAEAVVIFNSELTQHEGFLRRRNGQLYSKMRFLSVQLLAMTSNGIAERNALNANAMASRLTQGLVRIPGTWLLHPVEINEIFISLPELVRERLAARGYVAQLRGFPDEPHFRFVTAWNSSVEAVDAFIAAAAET